VEAAGGLGGGPPRAVGYEGRRRVAADGWDAAGNGFEAGPTAVDPEPPDLVRRKIRQCRLLLRDCWRGRRRAHKRSQDRACKEPCTPGERGHHAPPAAMFPHI